MKSPVMCVCVVSAVANENCLHSDLASGCSEFEMVALGDDFACGEWL